MQGYWLKNLTSSHLRVAVQLNHTLDGERPLPDSMTFIKTILCQKDPVQSSAVDNYHFHGLLQGLVSHELTAYLPIFNLFLTQ